MDFKRRHLSESVESWIDSADTNLMTDEEVWWQKRITSILLNKSGKWGLYQHVLYAKRFQDFVLKVVPLSVTKDEPFTACVLFEKAVIYVGEGFLIDDSKCYQLNVIIRHELAHVLLRHQIRMMHEIGESPYSRVRMSSSIGELINIIADFEISNKKYTSEDKKIILNLYINGQVIKGLVTEMHRADWAKLPIEEMYHKLLEELDTISSDITSVSSMDDLKWTGTGSKLRRGDTIASAGAKALTFYADLTTPSIIWHPIDEYMQKSKRFSKIAPVWQNIVVETYNTCKDKSESELKELLEKTAKSKLVEPVEINDKLTVFIPEEKFWVVQVLKTLLGNCKERPKTLVKKAEHSKAYKDAWNTVMRACGKRSLCSDEELEDIIGAAMTGSMPTTDETPVDDISDEE